MKPRKLHSERARVLQFYSIRRHFSYRKFESILIYSGTSASLIVVLFSARHAAKDSKIQTSFHLRGKTNDDATVRADEHLLDEEFSVI